jgi:hypothetical protein
MVDDSDYYGSIIDFNAFSLVVDEVWRTLFKKYITTPTPLNEVRSIPYSLLSIAYPKSNRHQQQYQH